MRRRGQGGIDIPAKSARVNYQRTDALRRAMPHMSQSAMAALVKFAKANDLSDIGSSRASFQRARDACLEDTPFAPQIITCTLFGDPPFANKDILIVNPAAYLYLAYTKGGGFFKHLNKCLASTPSSAERPWRLVLYSDEVVPGNQLAIANSRKVWVVYFGFLELKQMGNEDSWCPLAAEPSHGLKRVSAGISQVFAVIIESFFGLQTYDMRGGIQLEGPNGERLRLFAVLSMVLQDGGAQKFVWSCKGDGGTRPCFLCKNLVSSSSSVAACDVSGMLVDDMVDADRLIPATNEDIRNAIKRLAPFKETDSAGDFKLREQAIGFTLQNRALLTQPELEDIV